MGTHRETKSIEVGASADAVFHALTDFERLPEWQGAIKSCVVLERGPDGMGREVEYVLDAKIREVRYVLALDYDRPHLVRSTYVRGDIKDMNAEWRMDPVGDGTKVSLHLEIDPGLPLPGPIKRQVRNLVLGRVLDDLARYLDG
jgi:ribosome-associated toxin RatA of RatAB toxin-antitoxin module